MPPLNFQKRFANKVKRNTKPGTIRGPRKKPIKPGDTLYLFTGMRTKNCVRLATRKCINTYTVFIWKRGTRKGILFYERDLTIEECEAFARMDGFKTFDEMIAFFEPRMEPVVGFMGTWIVWKQSAIDQFISPRS